MFEDALSSVPSGTACSVAAAGVVCATVAELADLRSEPGVPGSPTIAPRFLRYADEQTVAGMAAVLRATCDPAMQGEAYGDWGVVAASVFPGRLAAAGTFTRFDNGGPAAVSPHVISQNSLHSVAGALSVGLAMHGPNFGIGGGREALAEGLTVAASLVGIDCLPGLWLVLTQWTPEPTPDGNGSTQTDARCLAVALALRRPGQRGLATLRFDRLAKRTLGERGLRFFCAEDPIEADAAPLDCRERLSALARWLTVGSAGRRAAPWSVDLPWGGRVDLAHHESQQRARAA